VNKTEAAATGGGLTRTSLALSALTLAALVTGVSVVVFAYVSHLPNADATRSTGPGPSGPAASAPTETQGPDRVAIRKPERSGPGAVPGPIPTQSGESADIVTYSDPVFGFRLDHLETWKPVVVETHGGAFALTRKQYNVLFVHQGSPGRLAVTVLDDVPVGERDLVSLAALLDPEMKPVDGRKPTNATIAGRPALIVWRQETPIAPTTYAAVLHDAGTAYAIQYEAADGGRMLEEFLRAIVTFELGPGNSPDTVPPMPRPTPRFYPQDVLP